MEFVDLRKQYQHLKTEIDAAIQEVLQHGKYIMGPEVGLLESQLAAYVGVKHCITCSNGTDALLMPLMAWGITKGDAVFTTAFSFFATAEVISLLGATPVFVDIEPDTFLLSPQSLEEQIKRILREGILKPRAVIPVDLFGLPADYEAISKIAVKYDLMILEDSAQGFGGVFQGKKAGCFGTAGTTSFFPAKPLGCYGDGGAIFTDNDALAALLKSIRVHGHGEDKYDNVRIGLNARLDTLQAAILLPKLKAFREYELEQRNRIASIYSDELAGYVQCPAIPEGRGSSWAQYTIRLESQEQRDFMKDRLSKASIPAMIYYAKPLHLQTAYLELGYRPGDLPEAEKASNTVLSLPMHPYMLHSEISTVAESVRQSIRDDSAAAL